MEETLTEGEKSNGQKFKEKHGYSKTVKRLMEKHGVGIEDLKRRRKERKRTESLKKKDKKAISKVTRGSKKK